MRTIDELTVTGGLTLDSFNNTLLSTFWTTLEEEDFSLAETVLTFRLCSMDGEMVVLVEETSACSLDVVTTTVKSILFVLDGRNSVDNEILSLIFEDSFCPMIAVELGAFDVRIDVEILSLIFEVSFCPMIAVELGVTTRDDWIMGNSISDPHNIRRTSVTLCLISIPLTTSIT